MSKVENLKEYRLDRREFLEKVGLSTTAVLIFPTLPSLAESNKFQGNIEKEQSYVYKGPYGLPIRDRDGNLIGEMFLQAGGGGGRGFRVEDSQDVKFYTGMRDIGFRRLGYPISRRYVLEGYPTQLFQNNYLQFKPSEGLVLGRVWEDISLIERANPKVSDELRLAGVPASESGNYSEGERLGWLEPGNYPPEMQEGVEKIKESFYGLGGISNGLPSTKVEGMGPFLVMRSPGICLQYWREDIEGVGVKGTVNVVSGGEWLKKFITTRGYNIPDKLKVDEGVFKAEDIVDLVEQGIREGWGGDRFREERGLERMYKSPNGRVIIINDRPDDFPYPTIGYRLLDNPQTLAYVEKLIEDEDISRVIIMQDPNLEVKVRVGVTFVVRGDPWDMKNYPQNVVGVFEPSLHEYKEVVDGKEVERKDVIYRINTNDKILEIAELDKRSIYDYAYSRILNLVLRAKYGREDINYLNRPEYQKKGVELYNMPWSLEAVLWHEGKNLLLEY